jgi:long-chain-fatty-acid---luciferin-component ligase
MTDMHRHADAALMATGIDRLDALMGADGVMALDPRTTAATRVDLLRTALTHHLEVDDAYARYAETLRFSPEQLQGVADLGSVPLLPSALFKHPTALRDPSPPVVATTSSGTKGSVSVVPRDDVTLMRFFASVMCGTREVLGVDDFATPMHHLGPDPIEAHHLWIAYVVAGCALYFPCTHHIADGVLDPAAVVAALDAAEGPVVVVGPPALIARVVADLGGRRIRLPAGSQLVTVGGWKRAEGTVVSAPELQGAAADALGITPADIRDTFNMVELNTAIFECRAHRKHIPPWLTVRARSPRDLAVQPAGDQGILAYLDPGPTSFPGFVLSDDLGRVDEDVACECGLTTDVLHLDRRVSRLEQRGCALKVDASTRRKSL